MSYLTSAVALIGLALPSFAQGNLSGTWAIDLVGLTTSDPIECPLFTTTVPAQVIHTGSSITMIALDGSGLMFTGSIAGNVISISASYPDDGGVTNTDIILLATAYSLTGGSNWEWCDAGNPCAVPGSADCVGSTQWTGRRQYVDLCNSSGTGGVAGCQNCPCMNNATHPTIGGCLNSVGSAARLLASGDTSISLPLGVSSDLRFGIEGVPASVFSVLVSGSAVAPQNMANPCFGADSGVPSLTLDGLRCAVQTVQRHGGRAADSNGEIGTTNNPWGGEGGPPRGIADVAGFAVGQARYFQAIYREDPLLGCMRGLNTSQAVQIIFTP